MRRWRQCVLLALSFPGVCLQAADISVEEYYGDFKMPLLENTSFEEVRKYLLQGRPFAIRDGARGLPMASWDCGAVKEMFPNSRIRQEGGEGDTNDVKMSSDWTKKIAKFPHAHRFPEGAPRNRPFYWDIVKAAEGEPDRQWGNNPKKVVQEIVGKSAVPYWLPEQEAREMGQSSEMWFHPKGAGAPAHMDPHCQTTVSFCFSGKRKWRMMIPPPEPHPDGYFDGQIYQRGDEWQPTFEFEVEAGSAVIVFPGMVHETLSTGEECSSSISQTFAVPLAAAYYRAFWPRFALIHEDVGNCFQQVESMVAMGTETHVKPRGAKSAKKDGAAFAAKMDADGNGIITEAEIMALRAGRPRPGGSRRTLDEIVAFHDVDNDGTVTVKEVEESWIMFSTAQRRVAKLQREEGGEL